jgi:hypothetical protein
MSALAHMTAFMNPAIQSLDQNFKTALNHPARLLAKATGAITIPSVILWAVNHDDQKINDIRKTDAGVHFWFIRLGDGTIGKIPKPFLYGQVFGTTIETALDMMFTQDPRGMSRWAQGVVSMLGVNMLPTGVQMAASTFANKDWFSGMPITPMRQQGLDASVMGDSRVSSLARRIAQAGSRLSGGDIQIDPYQLDYFIRASGGTLAKDAVHLLDKPLQGDMPSVAKGDADTPFIGRFFADYPTKNVQPLRDFYESYSELARIGQTLKYLEDKDPASFETYLQTHLDEYGYIGLYNETKAQLDQYQEQINQISAIPDSAYSPEEKREIIKQLQLVMIDVARAVESSKH